MLAIDVGNTHIKSAIFDGPAIRDTFVLSTEECLRQDSYLGLIPGTPSSLPKTVVISSVRKSIREIMAREFYGKAGLKPFFVDIDTDMGIRNLYKTRETLGIDRLVNASAAHHLYHRGARPMIVVDMGTATTIDYIRADGSFLGGAIAPGLYSAYNGLRISAPALPEIEIAPATKVIGETTYECMNSGVIIAHAAMIMAMAAMMAADADPVVIITGGISRFLDAWFKEGYIIDRDLTLKGLRIIYERNAQK
jgi:type III pantothenate kinase